MTAKRVKDNWGGRVQGWGGRLDPGSSEGWGGCTCREVRGLRRQLLSSVRWTIRRSEVWERGRSHLQVSHREVRGLRRWPLSSAGEPSGGQSFEKMVTLICQVNHRGLRALRRWSLSSVSEPSGGQRFEKVAALVRQWTRSQRPAENGGGRSAVVGGRRGLLGRPIPLPCSSLWSSRNSRASRAQALLRGWREVVIRPMSHGQAYSDLRSSEWGGAQRGGGIQSRKQRQDSPDGPAPAAGRADACMSVRLNPFTGLLKPSQHCWSATPQYKMNSSEKERLCTSRARGEGSISDQVTKLPHAVCQSQEVN